MVNRRNRLVDVDCRPGLHSQRARRRRPPSASGDRTDWSSKRGDRRAGSQGSARRNAHRRRSRSRSAAARDRSRALAPRHGDRPRYRRVRAERARRAHRDREERTVLGRGGERDRADLDRRQPHPEADARVDRARRVRPNAPGAQQCRRQDHRACLRSDRREELRDGCRSADRGSHSSRPRWCLPRLASRSRRCRRCRPCRRCRSSRRAHRHSPSRRIRRQPRRPVPALRPRPAQGTRRRHSCRTTPSYTATRMAVTTCASRCCASRVATVGRCTRRRRSRSR